VAWFVFGDVVYFNQSVSGTFVSRTILNATWVIGLWMVALAATAVNRRRSGALRRKRRSTRPQLGVGLVGLDLLSRFW